MDASQIALSDDLWHKGGYFFRGSKWEKGSGAKGPGDSGKGRAELTSPGYNNSKLGLV